MSGEIVILVTSPPERSDAISRMIVEEGLAACVNIVPGIKSIYKWQGQISTDAEELLVIKSHSKHWEALQKRIKELHSYEVPEIICIDVQDGFAPYLEWIRSVLRP